MNPGVDSFLKKVKKWQPELTELRKILLTTKLEEEVKWGAPCYTYNSTNIVLIQGFKNYCVVMFFKGVLLKDEKKVLLMNGENAQASRKIQYTSIEDIKKDATLLKSYIKEAIELEKAGVKVQYKTREKLVLCKEFEVQLKANKALKAAFEKLTPGRQRAYNLYFSSAKQAETRETRVQKYIQRILAGKGIDDCTCGLSKRYPYCDGSHKILTAKK
jgi:uncharacterized protein YdeI (YjbR/CyaY-like superfamily)